MHGVSVSGGIISEEGMHCSASPQDAGLDSQGMGVFAISDPYGNYASHLAHADLDSQATPSLAVESTAQSAARAAFRAGRG